MIATIRANRISVLDINKVNLAEKRVGMIVPINYNNNYFIFQSPYFSVKQKFSVIKKNLYNVETDIFGESKSKTSAFCKFINEVESYITGKILSYGQKWFNNPNVYFKSVIKKDKNSEFIKWPINFSNTQIIDSYGNVVDPNDVNEGDLLRFIIEIPDLWISDSSNNFGLTIIVQKIMIKYKNKVNSHDTNYIFEDTESDPDMSEDKINIISSLATESFDPSRRPLNSCTKYSEKKYQLSNNRSNDKINNTCNLDSSSNSSNYSSPNNFKDRELVYNPNSYDLVIDIENSD